MTDTSAPTPLTPPAATKKYGGRNEILARAGKLNEAEVEIDGVTYIVRELDGLERAHLIGIQATARIGNKVDLEAWQRQIMLYGVVDPASPQGAREPAFTDADMATVMTAGAGFLEPLVEKIEELSGLGQKAKEQAEKRLGEAPSGSSGSASAES